VAASARRAGSMVRGWARPSWGRCARGSPVTARRALAANRCSPGRAAACSGRRGGRSRGRMPLPLAALDAQRPGR